MQLIHPGDANNFYLQTGIAYRLATLEYIAH